MPYATTAAGAKILPNGAIELARREGRRGRMFVLGYMPEEVQPFATWEITPEGVTHTGNYFFAIEEATDDLRERAS